MINFEPERYELLLGHKRDRLSELLQPLGAPDPQVFASPVSGFRMRAEFRVWHEGEDLFYAMFEPSQPRQPLRVDHFPIASDRIQQAMPALLLQLKDNDELRRKLFQVEFLSTLSGELLITLIYHRQLGENWEQQARPLQAKLQANLIGRARKQRLVLNQDYVDELLPVDGREFSYRQFEQGFTQPNARMNIQMIEWALAQTQHCSGDLLELYCGNGNFSLPLATRFGRVLATEVSKASMRAAHFNATTNAIENIELVRLAAEEVVQALAGTRPFRRLAHLPGGLEAYNFGTVFVDPPRAGLDEATTALVAGFDNIIYISCNPQTLARNIASLGATHQIKQCALFDQFPYTQHTECGVLLQRL